MDVRRKFPSLGPVVSLLLLLLVAVPAFAIGEKQVVTLTATPGSFPLALPGRAAPMVLDANDWPGVRRAADDFRHDVLSVSGAGPDTATTLPQPPSNVILVGTLGRSEWIDKLAAEGKINAGKIRGQWEAGLIAVVEHPVPGIDRALVIAGSDKRGTIFALYTLSEQIGVSPWSWWADVRTPHHDALFVQPGSDVLPSPTVRYRGIFLNDEAPALTGWAREKFGGLNEKFYEHVFELLLRLRANYLWPAMWSNAFNEDDPLDPKIADEYGIVMGTSHHEPMLRAQQEWKRHGTGAWDYTTNAAELQRFWTEGIQRNKEYESTITIGMRGDGDMAMGPSTNTALLEQIVADQRKIIAANEDPQHHDPQIWALYKEVQDYYDKGMRVPDDVTLLWSDDNWGNLRRVPSEAERKRPGGSGIYYHVDYVGGPRSYKWLNTYSITKMWEQMHLAAAYGANRVWILNVGDLKPMEFPMEFFLTLARDPGRWHAEDLDAYTQAWATREFGAEHAVEIARLMTLYTKYNSRRKPEQVEPTTYSFTAGHEAEKVEREWEELAAEAVKVGTALPADEAASFFELIGYPVEACANLGEMYIAAGRNRLYSKQGRASANFWADETEKHFAEDAALSQAYNGLLGGKWHHMMDQTHIGYTGWSDPPKNVMPHVERIRVPDAARLGVFVESAADRADALLPFDRVNRQVRAVDLALMGTQPVVATVAATEPWVKLEWGGGTLSADKVLHVSIDWTTVPSAAADAVVTVSAQGEPPRSLRLHVLAVPANARGFVEDAGVVAIDAEHTTSREPAPPIEWRTLPNHGPMLSGIEAFPVVAPSTPVGGQQACVDYDFTLLSAGERTLQTMLAPTLPFIAGQGLRYSVAVDGQKARTIDAWEHYAEHIWGQAVSDGVHRVSTPIGRLGAGAHTLRVCRVDPGVVLERLLIFQAQPPEYLGPPESANVARVH